MKLTIVHLDFWYAAKGIPGWADQLRRKPDSPGDLIDGCINAHAGIRSDWLEAGNLMNLVRSAHRRGEDVLAYLDRIAADPGCLIRPERRAGYAKKWATRIRALRRAAGALTTV